MKSAANKLVLAILPVLMVITCNQESSVSSPERSLPREDPTRYGYSLWLIRMQEKLDNGYQLNDHTEYDNLIQGFALNTERVTLYLPTAPTYSSSMTENELLEYLGIMDNFSLNKGWVFFNHLEKNTIFLVLPDENPFSNDTIYYDFLTTYYEGADTIISALQIYDKIPSLLAHYLNSEPMKLSKSTSIIPVNGVCSNTDDWTNLGDIEAHYYTIIEYSLMLGFAGDKVKELLTEDLIGIIKAGSGGETIDFILDQIKQMTYLQFIDYLYDKGAISEALYTYLRTRNDWGARIDRYRLMLTQSNAINECSQQDARFLRYLCMNNFGNYNPAYDLDFKDFCSEYDQACQSIYSLQGVQLFFYFTGDQRTYFCASCDA
ncbi:MAG TPA: hypothetical protein DHU63_04520, partial [Candidatus Marinimicrobia bacterium]|nr:hypothetical protein [Candidatus Neomarinimicrobiota bacterium]